MTMKPGDVVFEVDPRMAPPPKSGRRVMRVTVKDGVPTDEMLITVGDGIVPPPGGGEFHISEFTVLPGGARNIIPLLQGIAVYAEWVYGFSVRIFVRDPGMITSIGLLFFDKDGYPTDDLPVGSTDFTPQAALDPNEWTEMNIQAVAHPEAVYMVPAIRVDPMLNTNEMWIAGAMVYNLGEAGSIAVTPPDRYLTLGDPAELIGIDRVSPEYEGYLLGESALAQEESEGGGALAGAYFFSQIFLDALYEQGTALFPVPVVGYFFHTATQFAINDPRYMPIDTVDELAQTLGWGPYIGIPSDPMPVGTTNIGRNHYVVLNNPITVPDNFPTYTVRAMALVYQGTLGGVENPIMMVTNSPFQGQTATIFHHTDSILSRRDSEAAGLRWLISWADPGDAPSVTPIQGPLALLRGAPDFETAHTQHAWMYPQRVNLVANPSFEGGTGWWRTNGTIEQIPGGAPGGGFKSGRFTGPAPIIAESNYFPIMVGKSATDEWTIQLMARGQGRIRVGLLSWPSDYSEVFIDWGAPEESYELPSTGYYHIYALRRVTDTDIGQVRIECQGSELILDNVLCEPNFLLYWPYFDGDSTYGARDDFSWYGGENLKGQSYSLWYNNRRAMIGRLFAWGIAETDPTITDEEVAKQGFVYDWVPAGTRVIPHLDVLFVNDIRNPIVDIEDTPITPDVPDPWEVTDITPPTAPLNLMADPGRTNVMLTWSASTDDRSVAFYRIERCQGPTCQNFQVAGTTPVLTYNDTGLLPEVTYRYRVAAVDPAGNVSAYSNIVTVTTEEEADLQPPTAPLNLVATPVAGHTDLTWGASTDNVGVDHYIIERCQNT